MRLKPFFSYYGAKWRASKLYPNPRRNLVIEPFAGSACYSLLHYTKKVILIDKDPTIAGLWKWLISNPKDEINSLPLEIESLDDLDNKVSQEARDLIGFWFTKGSIAPVKRKYAWARSGEWNSQFWGKVIKDRILSQLDYIKHWEVYCSSYEEIPDDIEGCWFIDPPYEKQGTHYRYNDINYEELGQWCRRRKNQVIVCEQEGAQWLPFKKLGQIKSLKSGKSNEVYYKYPEHQGALFLP